MRLQNIPPNNALALIGRMFPFNSDAAFLWNAMRHSIHTWNDFQRAFLQYEGPGNSMDNLISKLYSMSQKVSDPFETYAWSIYTLMKKIDANAQEDVIIQRILNSALPEISAILRQSQIHTVSELVSKGREVVDDLNRIRIMQGRFTLRARASDTVVPARNNRGDGGHVSGHSSNATAGSNQRSNQVQSSSTVNPHKDYECFYCKKMGHIKKDCRKRKWEMANSKSGSSSTAAKQKSGK